MLCRSICPKQYFTGSTKQVGFSLIELVTVVVILALIAAVALPKFMSVNSEARAAVVESVAGTMRSAANMTYSKALVKSLQAQSNSQIFSGAEAIPIAFGYPQAHRGIMQLIDVGKVSNYGRRAVNSDSDWVVHYWNWTVDRQQVPAIVIAQGKVTGDSNATAPLNTRCYVRYVQATASRSVEIITDTSGC